MFTNVNSRLSILSEKNKKGGDVTPSYSLYAKCLSAIVGKTPAALKA